jgi:hypothetical protein
MEMYSILTAMVLAVLFATNKAQILSSSICFQAVPFVLGSCTPMLCPCSDCFLSSTVLEIHLAGGGGGGGVVWNEVCDLLEELPKELCGRRELHPSPNSSYSKAVV